MKAIIFLLTAMATTAALSITALAAPVDEEIITDDRWSHSMETLQNRQEKIEERITFNEDRLEKLSSKEPEDAFIQLVVETQIGIVTGRLENLRLAADNNQLRLNFLTALNAIYENGGVLPQETITALKADNEQIKEIINSLKDTRGSIRDVMETYRAQIRAKDEEALEAAYSEILVIQQNRFDLLSQMNSLLEHMNDLIDGYQDETV